MNVQRRKVPLEELKEFDEVGACGTAVVITPVYEIDDKARNLCYKTGNPDSAGERSLALYKKLTGIQYGEEADTHNWCMML